MKKNRKILEGLQTIGTAPAAAVSVAERFVVAIEDIHAQQFAAMKVEQLTGEARLAAADRMRASEQEAIDAETNAASFTAEEGQIRAEARGAQPENRILETERERHERLIVTTDRARRATEMLADLQLVQALEDPAAIVGIVEEALLGGDRAVLGRLGPAALARLERLDRLDRSKHRNQGDYISPITPARRHLAEKFNAWRAEHPTPAERLAKLHQARASRVQDIRSGFDRVRRAMGLDDRAIVQRHGVRRVPEQGEGHAGSGMVFGRRFER